VRSDLEQTHQRVWDSLAKPGTWWNAAERIQIAREARAARAAEGLAGAPAGAATAELPAAASEVARRVGGAPKSIDRAWFEGLVPERLEDTHYVEAVGVVVRTVSVDVFCRGLGVPLHNYPDPEPGEPSRERPRTALVDEAWVPMIPNGAAGGEEAKATFGGTSANVIRALSLVPAEVRGISDVGNHQYLIDRHVLDPKHDPGRAISRAQIELVAGRISAINECFY
ncbi:MAG: hypothetical protein HKP27_03445, partial [Myxococcales bacterium]|nr:hypothetical protein [Myxococcales bacterium]